MTSASDLQMSHRSINKWFIHESVCIESEVMVSQFKLYKRSLLSLFRELIDNQWNSYFWANLPLTLLCYHLLSSALLFFRPFYMQIIRSDILEQLELSNVSFSVTCSRALNLSLITSTTVCMTPCLFILTITLNWKLLTCTLLSSNVV